MWTGAELKSDVNAIKVDDHKVGVNKLATWDNHALWVIKREGDGEAEVHDTQVDVIFVTSGEGTLVLGGTMVEPRTTAPGETRAKSIKGGVSKKMSPGDVFHIPVKVPHQMLVPKLLTFEVLKVDSK